MGCGGSKSSKSNKERSKKPASVNISPAIFLTKTKGRLSNNYAIVRKLGSGAFADVQLCLYKPLGQQRAVKIIHKAGLHHQQMDENDMLKETAILSSLDHPNILKCYEIFEDNWKFYVATDYCEGGELFEKIVKLKKFTEVQASYIMYQLLSAIAYCHDKKVIHRDLKPENILLDDTGDSLSIKVADFGSSCFLDSKRKLSGCFGSAYYVAPEVLDEEYNEKCDIWSVGVILYILLTGKPPYNCRDEKAILKRIKTSPLVINKADWPHLSPDAIDLLQQLLVVSPKHRISAKTALEHKWIQSHRHGTESPDLTQVLKELSDFSCSMKLKDAVHMFLASQAINKKELKALKESFLQIDKNGDGKINKSELIQQYIKTMEEEEAKATVEKIMNDVDKNNSGDIDYTEFIAACINYNDYNSKSNLEAAFSMFDKDRSGFITVDEIKSVLGHDNISDDKVWAGIITEADQNGDGVIDLKEFITIMNKKN